MVLIELFYSMGEEFWVDTGQIYTWTELNLNLVLAPHDKNLNWTEVHRPLWTDELKEVHLEKNFYSPALYFRQSAPEAVSFHAGH